MPKPPKQSPGDRRPPSEHESPQSRVDDDFPAFVPPPTSTVAPAPELNDSDAQEADELKRQLASWEAARDAVSAHSNADANFLSTQAEERIKSIRIKIMRTKPLSDQKTVLEELLTRRIRQRTAAESEVAAASAKHAVLIAEVRSVEEQLSTVNTAIDAETAAAKKAPVLSSATIAAFLQSQPVPTEVKPQIEMLLQALNSFVQNHPDVESTIRSPHPVLKTPLTGDLTPNLLNSATRGRVQFKPEVDGSEEPPRARQRVSSAPVTPTRSRRQLGTPSQASPTRKGDLAGRMQDSIPGTAVPMGPTQPTAAALAEAAVSLPQPGAPPSVHGPSGQTVSPSRLFASLTANRPPPAPAPAPGGLPDLPTFASTDSTPSLPASTSPSSLRRARSSSPRTLAPRPRAALSPAAPLKASQEEFSPEPFREVEGETDDI